MRKLEEGAEVSCRSCFNESCDFGCAVTVGVRESIQPLVSRKLYTYYSAHKLTALNRDCESNEAYSEGEDAQQGLNWLRFCYVTSQARHTT